MKIITTEIQEQVTIWAMKSQRLKILTGRRKHATTLLQLKITTTGIQELVMSETMALRHMKIIMTT